MLRKAVFVTALSCVFLACDFPALVHAATVVTEGDDAKKLYEAEKGKAKILVQKDKNFILRVGSDETVKPAELKLKAGERFFIINEEMEYVHNVYDESDSGWVLKKQEPASVAAVSFDSPGEHKLRCAIHPQMRIIATVQ
jgi:plastocyanin